jgi:tetratricopeptide (TPR) repeat protein
LTFRYTRFRVAQGFPVNRIILFCIALAFVAIAPAQTAWADDPAPSKEQLEAAKKAFGEGKSLYDEGKFAEAVEKFKESYRLSRNPLLLYNIGHTLDQAGQKDKALFYYRKFLADAPQNAPQRKDVSKRVDVIEKENLEADLNGTSTTTTTTAPTTAVTTAKPEEPKKDVKIKPAGTYTEKDFEHQLVEVAPPGKPLDVTAFVPEDSGFTVTLYYRGSGDAKFVAKQMKPRYKELVARIPGAKIGGTSIQYYIEAKDQAGNVVAKSGKSTSPNLINVEAGATPRFYPDLTDDGEQAMTATQVKARDESDDPLSGRTTQEADPEDQQTSLPEESLPPGNGFRDVGSSKFTKAKWISTGAAGLFVGAAVATWVLGNQQESNLLADRDARMGEMCTTPPCFEFDSYDLDVQKAGQRYNTIHQVSTVLGVAAVGVAGYFWYRELTAKKRGELKVGNKNSSPETSWAITPSFSEGYTGAAAAARF